MSGHISSLVRWRSGSRAGTYVAADMTRERLIFAVLFEQLLQRPTDAILRQRRVTANATATATARVMVVVVVARHSIQRRTRRGRLDAAALDQGRTNQRRTRHGPLVVHRARATTASSWRLVVGRDRYTTRSRTEWLVVESANGSTAAAARSRRRLSNTNRRNERYARGEL